MQGRIQASASRVLWPKCERKACGPGVAVPWHPLNATLGQRLGAPWVDK